MNKRYQRRFELIDTKIIEKLEELSNGKFFKNNTFLYREIIAIGTEKLHMKFFNPVEYYKEKANIVNDKPNEKIYEFIFKDLTTIALTTQIIKELISSLFNIEISKIENEKINSDDAKKGYLASLPEYYQKMEELVQEKLNSRFELLMKENRKN